MTETDLLQTMDAQVWAREFCRIAKETDGGIDEAWMTTWFANAIMAGWDGRGRHLEARRSEWRALSAEGADPLENIKTELGDYLVDRVVERLEMRGQSLVIPSRNVSTFPDPPDEGYQPASTGDHECG